MRNPAVFLLVWLALQGPGCSAQSGSASITVDPSMTRGAATAPVTIVEFSDYQ